MPLELVSLYSKLPFFAMVASRIAGIIALQPIFGALAVPVRLRALFAIALAILVTPFVQMPAALPDSAGALILAIGGELLLGGVLGTAVALCFVGMQLGGMLIAQEAGLNFGQIADPNSGDDVTVVSVLYTQLAGVLFLVAGGHRMIMTVCLDTFQTIPLVGDPARAEMGFELLLDVFAMTTEMAFRLAIPTVITLMLVNVAMGFISRTVPQFNVLSVGFAIKTMIAFIIMAATLPLGAEVFVASIEEVADILHDFTG